MVSPVKRRYNSVTRREGAASTRDHILETAARLFADAGYGPTTMEAIAAAAEVGVATVYANFGTKPGIVEALVDQATGDERLDVELFARELDLGRALRRGARIIRELHEQSAALTDLLVSARGSEPALRQLWDRWQDQHAAAMKRAATELGRRGALRRGVSPDEAADVLYALADSETYRALVWQRGWSPKRYEAWLLQAGSRLLLDP
jgi:TetR/AcrR family transcriptional regulator, regulator of autoinduction and epiphytic fitness